VNFPNDFAACRDDKTRLIEIYQASRAQLRVRRLLQAFARGVACSQLRAGRVDQGTRFGIIASTDHGYGGCYACVLAKSLDRADIFDALLQRRTYGATTKVMFIELRAADAIMGEELTLAAGGAPRSCA
jgi:hypothetical protein